MDKNTKIVKYLGSKNEVASFDQEPKWLKDLIAMRQIVHVRDGQHLSVCHGGTLCAKGDSIVKTSAGYIVQPKGAK
jgi:hypothetical protein